MFDRDLSSADVKPILEAYKALFLSDPILRQLFDANLIRTDHPFNCGFACRNRETDLVIFQATGKRFPSGGVKFGIGSEPTMAASTEKLYHGNITGQHLAAILSTGLGAYPGGVHGLATRSPQLAGEAYGYHAQLSDGHWYVVYVELASVMPTTLMCNTFDCAYNANGTIVTHGTRLRDNVLLDDQLECVVDVRTVQVRGLFVQQYSADSDVRKLTLARSHGHRTKHLAGLAGTLVPPA